MWRLIWGNDHLYCGFGARRSHLTLHWMSAQGSVGFRWGTITGPYYANFSQVETQKFDPHWFYCRQWGCNNLFCQECISSVSWFQMKIAHFIIFIWNHIVLVFCQVKVCSIFHIYIIIMLNGRLCNNVPAYSEIPLNTSYTIFLFHTAVCKPSHGHSAVLTTVDTICLNQIPNLVHGDVWLVNDDPYQHMQSSTTVIQLMKASDIGDKTYYSKCYNIITIFLLKVYHKRHPVTKQ